jgi:hypothetical protein
MTVVDPIRNQEEQSTTAERRREARGIGGGDSDRVQEPQMLPPVDAPFAEGGNRCPCLPASSGTWRSMNGGQPIRPALLDGNHRPRRPRRGPIRTDGSGRPYWGYELITFVQSGDIVVHWHKTLAGEPALVAWSEATGAYEDTDISWQAHGTVGRARGSLEPRPAWRMPLVNFTPLTEPVLISEVRALEPQLREAQST